MMFSLYNTLSRKKEELKPIHKDWVGLYTCGPTVYNYAHIGNLRTYIFEDILQRTLQYDGYTVRRIMNITDVGHLTGDTDAGEDKLEKAAHAQKKSVEEIAQFYTDAFFADLEKLNILKPDITARATDHIREQIALIEMLFEKGIAYDTPDAVYFDVGKIKDYGKLSGQSLKDKMTGAREEVIVDTNKHNTADFALWFKLEGKFKKHVLHWPSPWGEGFPGWHIECSAISRHFLSQPFDIHTGGVDHIGTHHTNEIAQSEAAYDAPLANLWVHGEFLIVNDAKMAKSAGNFLTLGDLEKKGYAPIIFRYLLLGAHYRTPLTFSWESLDAAKNGLQNIYGQISECFRKMTLDNKDATLKKSATDSEKNIVITYENSFKEAINDDLNTSKALAILQDVLFSSLTSASKLTLTKKFDEIFGLRLNIPMEYSLEKDMVAFEKLRIYKQLRDSKQFVQSDDLRKDIEALGYKVRDTGSDSYVVKKFF
jgi:cysteinyl-tRNA synthetase